MSDSPQKRDRVMRDGDPSYYVAETRTDCDGTWVRVRGKRVDTWVHVEELEGRLSGVWVWH